MGFYLLRFCQLSSLLGIDLAGRIGAIGQQHEHALGGGIILFTYAVYRRDPVFILGQSTGLLIYSRNLWLIHAEKRAAL